MKVTNLKLITLALLVAFFWSCEKDVEDFNDAEEAITETAEDSFVNTKADPSMTYYLHGKQLTDTDEIENLLKTAMHMEVDENNWNFYPTEAEQKSRLEVKEKSNSSQTIKQNTYLFHYGKHNNRPFHYMTNQSNNHYGTTSNLVHHHSNRRFKIKLWQKITRGLTLMNFNKSFWQNPTMNSSGYTFYSKNNYRGRSIWYGIGANKRRVNINLPWHIGSHKNY